MNNQQSHNISGNQNPSRGAVNGNGSLGHHRHLYFSSPSPINIEFLQPGTVFNFYQPGNYSVFMDMRPSPQPQAQPSTQAESRRVAVVQPVRQAAGGIHPSPGQVSTVAVIPETRQTQQSTSSFSPVSRVFRMNPASPASSDWSSDSVINSPPAATTSNFNSSDSCLNGW